MKFNMKVKGNINDLKNFINGLSYNSNTVIGRGVSSLKTEIKNSIACISGTVSNNIQTDLIDAAEIMRKDQSNFYFYYKGEMTSLKEMNLEVISLKEAETFYNINILCYEEQEENSKEYYIFEDIM